jgi:RNA polymerase sigma factor for flagellar operon FliA
MDAEAAERYDDTRQEPFLAFAEHRIRGAVLDELRRGDIMPRRVRQLARKIAAAIRELEKDGETPTDQRISDALGVSIDDNRAGLSELVHVEVGPIDEATRLVSNNMAPDMEAEHRMTLTRVRGADSYGICASRWLMTFSDMYWPNMRRMYRF